MPGVDGPEGPESRDGTAKEYSVQPGRRKRRDDLCRETPTDPGGGGGGQPPRSVMQVDSLTLMAVVWPSPNERACRSGPCLPLLGHPQTEPSHRLAAEHPGSPRSDRELPGPAKTGVQDLRVVSEAGQGSVLAGVPDIRRERGRMRPARQQKNLSNKPERANVINNDFTEGVAVAATPPVMLAGDVAIGKTSLVDFAGGASLAMAFPAVAGGHPWLIMPRCCLRPLLGWSPRPILLE